MLYLLRPHPPRHFLIHILLPKALSWFHLVPQDLGEWCGGEASLDLEVQEGSEKAVLGLASGWIV